MRDAWIRRNLKINLPACSLRLFLLLRSIKSVALSKQKNRSFWDQPLLFGSGGAICTLATAAEPIAVLEVPLIATWHCALYLPILHLRPKNQFFRSLCWRCRAFEFFITLMVISENRKWPETRRPSHGLRPTQRHSDDRDPPATAGSRTSSGRP